MNADSLIPIVAGTLLVTVLVVFIILFVILYKRAQLKFELERQQFKETLLQTEVEISEQTMANISREMHDNFGQIASLIKIHLSMLSEDQNEEDKMRISESVELLKTLIMEIRSLSTSLNSQNLKEQGLLMMIENDVERVRRTGFINIILNYKPLDLKLDPSISIILYRLFQEMINNILKHAEATEAQVGLSVSNGILTMSVSDNGIGMPPESKFSREKSATGNGLLNLQERCRIIGATYTIESSPNKGTFIEIKLPT